MTLRLLHVTRVDPRTTKVSRSAVLRGDPLLCMLLFFFVCLFFVIILTKCFRLTYGKLCVHQSACFTIFLKVFIIM